MVLSYHTIYTELVTQLIYTGGPDQFETRDFTHHPGGTYTFKVEVTNGAGGLNSSTSSMVLPLDSPANIVYT